MSVWLPNNYRIAWNCNSVVDVEVGRKLAQDWADKTGRTFYVPDLGMFGPSGDTPDPGPDPEPSFDPLVVGTPVVTGDAIVGYTLTCSEPSIQGGSGDCQVTYYWQDANNNRVLYMGSTQLVKAVDLGRTIHCQVAVADQKTGEAVTVVSNDAGPVNRPVLDEYDLYIDGVLTDQASQHGMLPSATAVFEIRPKGDVTFNPKDVTFAWSIRTGTGRLSGDTDKSAVIYMANDTAPSAALIQCRYASMDANDNAVVDFEILVSS